MWDVVNAFVNHPATPFGVLTAVVLLIFRLHAKMVTGVVESQKDLATTLNNHFTESQTALQAISGHMATQNEILRALSGELLKAALRAPDQSAVHIPIEAIKAEVRDVP